MKSLKVILSNKEGSLKNPDKKVKKINKIKKLPIANLALQYLIQESRWNLIYQHILDNGYEKKPNEKPNRKALLDSETLTICLVIYTSLRYKNELFTIRSLARQLDSSDKKATLSKARKIKRLLDSIKQYKIIKYYVDEHKGERKCIRIEATELLIAFIEEQFFNHKGK